MAPVAVLSHVVVLTPMRFARVPLRNCPRAMAMNVMLMAMLAVSMGRFSWFLV